MSLTAAVSGFIVLLLSAVVQGQNGWGVTYTFTNACAQEGSTVVLSCSYTHPSTGNGQQYTVQKSFWFTKVKGGEAVDLTADSAYRGRVMYSCKETNCSLMITDLRESDSAEYKFRFITNQPGGRYIGYPGVSLSVKGLQVKVSRYTLSEWAHLKCHNSCPLPPRSSYIWYKNGDDNQAENSSSYSDYFNSADSYSCAVKGHKEFPSPPVCVFGRWCNRVTYSKRRICALEGSSVDIPCTYTSQKPITSKFWFRPGLSDQPEDLKEDPQYSSRAQVLETERGRSTLRISDLRESDSAEYGFRFTSGSFGWRSRLPGTTLTVTALQVQVTKITAGGSDTQVELRCLSSCSPAAGLSYVWLKNGQKIPEEETSSYTGCFSLGEEICCAVKGHEGLSSPPVYAPKDPSVSSSSCAEIVEQSSVTLTCSSDANPAANFSWYKKNQDSDFEPFGEEAQLVFSSIQPSDSGEFYCEAENQLGKRRSELFSVSVKYAPKLPSVSVSPSAKIVEGSSVTLTCSSDANPAANFSWFKESEDSPKASGQTFIITNVSTEHSGNYFCEAGNTRGRHNSTFLLIMVADQSSLIISAIRLTLAAVILTVSLLICLKMRTKMCLSSDTEPEETIELDNIITSTLKTLQPRQEDQEPPE
ncbi:Fc receptor-like protein 2 isoform X1 [Xyrichtys novacula]|uniref:B-cell receptor CD22 n=1 Tax=Xyrichtys novacula TaxID=13765 RepID=A0AAV1EYI5_XYRNO|nr:Fc receptor-like protein 2 isoform X1 [Xyrichtys novacula]